MSQLQYLFSLITFTVFQTALGRATDVHNLEVIGGHNITIAQAPYIAGLFQRDRLVCGGSIIHEQFILTSAACIKASSPITRVHIGSNLEHKGGYFPSVADNLCHEDYNRTTHDNDICLLKLREPVTFIKNKIAKIELSKEKNIEPGHIVYVTGWGKTAGSGKHSPACLQQAKISVLSDVSCHFIYGKMTENMLCAGSEGRDTCAGDSGGPLTQNNMQIGIVGFGPARCDKPTTIYTRVSKYTTWIEEKIKENSR